MKSAPARLGCVILVLLERLLVAAVAAVATGCAVDFIRVRAGNPFKAEEYDRLEVGKTTRVEAVDRLGAPEKIEWKSGNDYLWYLYTDSMDTGVRFQFPPFRTGLGYQHTFLRLNEKAEDVSALALVFDEKGVLKQKSLRLSQAYVPPPERPVPWVFSVAPRFAHSFGLFGDAGVADYDKVFADGYRAGLDFGFQPVPVVTLLGGVSYQEHQGRSFRRRGERLAFDDLKLHQVELGLRLEAPLSLLYNLTDFDHVRRVLFHEDPSQATGVRIYVQGTTGINFSSDVKVKADHVPAGRFYDASVGFGGSLEGGLQYSWGWGAAQASIAYETLDPFDPGNSRFDDRGGAFQALLLGGALSIRF